MGTRALDALRNEPVIAQAGGSAKGRTIAARYADTIVAHPKGVDGMKDYRQDVRSQMVAFGRDGVLKPNEVDDVVAYVRSLSDPASAKGIDTKRLEAGKTLFAANCASCHGDNATGNTELGAPNLTDKFWIYGGDLQSVTDTVWGGRQGHMPSWEGRLSPLDRKILTLYLTDLRNPNQ